MNIDMDTPTETEADTFDAVLADNHHPFSELRQHWADNPTDETTWTLYGAIIAASTLDPHLSIDALARLYQLPLDLVTQALTV